MVLGNWLDPLFREPAGMQLAFPAAERYLVVRVLDEAERLPAAADDPLRSQVSTPAVLGSGGLGQLVARARPGGLHPCTYQLSHTTMRSAVSRIPVHTIDGAPAEMLPILAGLTGGTRTLLSIRAEVADAPVVLTADTGIGEVIAEHGGLGVSLAPMPPGGPAVGRS